MSTIIETSVTSSAADASTRITRVSARIGLVFTVCQLTVMVAMTTLVLPKGGSLTKGPSSGATTSSPPRPGTGSATTRSSWPARCSWASSEQSS